MTVDGEYGKLFEKAMDTEVDEGTDQEKRFSQRLTALLIVVDIKADDIGEAGWQPILTEAEKVYKWLVKT